MTASDAGTPTFAEWAIVELMGHRRLAGHLTEQQIAGTAFLRLDVYVDDSEPIATQFYAPAAVYCITPTTDAIAHRIASENRPHPATRWELRALGTTEEDPF